ncbi:hypothetical protein L2E82_16065 [Cichorium intybus]|uniref:Uncharacterized protein n=1 Tax=Cichorium intybus TaxID=13427 RepID=A0ACB9F5T3_CICIN|nr:hypothetical protein L2E82_16065 [Cichorium intybus]
MKLKQELGTIVGMGDFQAIKETPAGDRRGAPKPLAGCAQAHSNLDHRLVMVWDKMVVVHVKARNNRELNAASIQVTMIQPVGLQNRM